LLKGTCATLEKADQAAAYERERPELLEERAVRILKGDDRFKDALWIGVENTGGGNIAAAIYPAKGSPYVWITDAEDYEQNPTKPFFYWDLHRGRRRADLVRAPFRRGDR
jgi:hypothetical protein